MLNRKEEARKAIAFASEVATALPDQTVENPVLAVLQKYRREDSMAVVPTLAKEVSLIYADMIAEYHVRCETTGELTADELALLDDDAKTVFTNLLTGDYAQHQRGVYETLIAHSQFREAMEAYALLSPGSKSKDAKDAEPSREQIEAAILSARKKTENQRRLTFDVRDHMISPLERYARALSKLKPEGEFAANEDDAAEWRIPLDVCLNAASAAEVVLLTILYYRNRPTKTEKYTDYYPISLREVGIYMTDHNQGEVMNTLIDKPNDESAPKKTRTRSKAVYLKFHQIPFPGNHTQTLVALKQEAVEKFIACNRDGAAKDSYISVSGETPRGLLHAVEHLRIGFEALYEEYMTTVYATDCPEWTQWLSTDGEVVRASLLNRLNSEFGVAVMKSEGFKALKMFTRSSQKWVLKTMLAVHWLQLTEKEKSEKHTVALSDLSSLLSGDVSDVFGKLEAAKRRAFNAGSAPESKSMRLKYTVNGSGPSDRTITYEGKY